MSTPSSNAKLAAGAPRPDDDTPITGTTHGLPALLAEVLAGLPDAVVVAGEGGRVVWANAAAETLLGVKGRTLLGQGVDAWRAGPRPPGHRELVASATEWRGEANLVRRDGRLVAVAGHARRLEAAPSIVVYTWRDATEDRRMQRTLLQNEKMTALGRMLSGVAHELNNPLTAVLGFSQLLLSDGQLAASHRADVRRIHAEAARCRASIEKMVRVARPGSTSGGEGVSKSLVRVELIVDEVLALREYEFRAHDVVIERDYEPGLPPVMARHDELQQVFLHIASNAYDAMRDAHGGGVLRVSARAVDGRVVVEFADTGPGLRQPEHVFDPFYTTKEPGKGTGLGLSLSYGIVGAHGGRMTATNGEGGGARVLVELPATEAPGARDHAAMLLAQAERSAVRVMNPDGATTAGLVAPMDSRRALVVDDEESVVELMRRMLGRLGFECDTAPSGRVALERLAASTRYDVVLTDLRMPGGVHGVDLYRWICEHRPELVGHVVLMTGDVADPETRRFVDDTGIPCVIKPFSMDEVAMAMMRALRGAASLRPRPEREPREGAAAVADAAAAAHAAKDTPAPAAGTPAAA